MDDKVIKLADHNHLSSSRSVQDALEEAIAIAKDGNQEAVFILLLDNKGDNYDIHEISAGLDRNTDVVALLDIAKTRVKTGMGF
nr:hypothetical protein [Nanoarchaeota archaeon]